MAAAGGAPEVIAQLENAAKVLMVRRAAAAAAGAAPGAPAPVPSLPPSSPPRLPPPAEPPAALASQARGAARRGAAPPPPPPRLLPRPGRPPSSPSSLPPSFPSAGDRRAGSSLSPRSRARPPPRTPRRSSMCRPLSSAPGRLIPAGCPVLSASRPPPPRAPAPPLSAAETRAEVAGEQLSLPAAAAGPRGASRGSGGVEGGRARSLAQRGPWATVGSVEATSEVPRTAGWAPLPSRVFLPAEGQGEAGGSRCCRREAEGLVVLRCPHLFVTCLLTVRAGCECLVRYFSMFAWKRKSPQQRSEL